MKTAFLGISLLVALMLTACSDDDDPGCTGDELTACEMVEQHQGCAECYDGDVTCTFGAYSATEPSCGGCQARWALLQQLCDAGVDACEEELNAGIECHDAD
jgi:hypothetical protein